MRGRLPFLLCLSTGLAMAGPAFAWGSLGHRLIGVVAAKNFGRDIPAFLRTPEAIFDLGEEAREPDRSRDSGQPHDWDRDPGHFIDGSDDGTVLAGPRLDALPPSRRDYDTALRAAGATQYQAGYLPYQIMDGWEQLVTDFAYWRADVAAAKYAKSPADRAWAVRDRKLREMLTLRDLGVWSHYVGDASQPLHVSVHYNGWGDYPNPENFADAPDIHGRFERDFVNANITERDIAARMRPYQPCGCGIREHAQSYLLATLGHVRDVYRLDTAHAFDAATPAARDFVAARIADGANMLRDMVEDAWAASARVSLGYPDKHAMPGIEAGRVDIMRVLRD